MSRPHLIQTESPSVFYSHKTPQERWDDAIAELLPREETVKQETADSNLKALFSALKESQKDEEPLSDYTPTKPKLQRQKGGHYMERLLNNSVLRLERAASSHTATQEKCLTWLCNVMESIGDEIIAQVKESAEKLKAKGTWSTLSKIASGALSALSFLFGASLVATGGGAILGSLLMASGYFGLVNLIFDETGVWDHIASELAGDNRELKQNLRNWLPFGLSILTMVTGAVGSTWASMTQAFNNLNLILLWGNSLTSIGESIMRMGQGVTQRDYLITDAKRDKTQARHEFTLGDLSSILNSIKEVKRGSGLCIKEARTAVTCYTRASNVREYQG